MISAFNTVYGALQGFFSRSFWFAVFLPVALFAVVHAAISYYVLVSWTFLGSKVSPDWSDIIKTGPEVIVVLVVVGYALQPFLPRFRGLLDGSQLPGFLHDFLRERRLADARAIAESLDNAFNEVGILKGLDDMVHAPDGVLRRAYIKAQEIKTATNSEAVVAAEAAIKKLAKGLASSAPLSGCAKSAVNAVLNVLKANNPNPKTLEKLRGGNVPEQEIERANKTDAVGDRLDPLITGALREVIYRYQVLQTRHRTVGAADSPHATRIGDARFLTERYASHVYNVDFDFLWPRLLVAIKAEKADDPILDAIEMARSRVDFAVMSLVLATTIPLFWLPTILFRNASAWLFFAIGASTPLILAFFYDLVFEAQLALSDIVKTTIDKSRFLVLKMLAQQNPLSRCEERALWARIADAEEDGRTTDLLYMSSSGIPK